MRNFFVLLLLGALLGTVAMVVRAGLLARDNPGRPINSAMRVALNQSAPQWSVKEEAEVVAKFPGAQKTESGLYFVVTKPGEEGPSPKMGDFVTVNYEGRFLDGMKFDSSYDRKQSFRFLVGIGKVIRGWDEAFLAMRKGERRTLIVPHWLGYGSKSRPPIPPRATLVFDVELVEFR